MPFMVVRNSWLIFAKKVALVPTGGLGGRFSIDRAPLRAQGPEKWTSRRTFTLFAISTKRDTQSCIGYLCKTTWLKSGESLPNLVA